MYVLKYVEKWDLRYWTVIGFLIQLFLIIIIDSILSLFPEKEINLREEPGIVTDLSFIEFQEPDTTAPAMAKELSETIIETTKKVQETINWNNAVDPALDFTQRYVAKISVQVSPDDYPQRARKANLGKVKVNVILYIGADGIIKDVKIRSIESSSETIQAFQEDFVKAVRKIFLEKSKLVSPPYKNEKGYQDFLWYTSVTFSLD